MLKYKNLCGIITSISLFLLYCSPYKIYVKVHPDFISEKQNIDTVSIITDAIVAIDSKNDYYCMKGSIILDSLIPMGVKKSLELRGYESKKIISPFAGAFLDTIFTVPYKHIESQIIDTIHLPILLTKDSINTGNNAFRNISRILYNHLIKDEKHPLDLPITELSIKQDMETLSSIINNDYVFFIFHQAGLVDPVVTARMFVGTLALTTILSHGMIIGYATKVSIYYTYIALLQLSTGKILWCNYSSLDAAPVIAIFNVCNNYDKSLSDYFKPDLLSKNVINRWNKKNLAVFPNKDDGTIFLGYKNLRKYPSKDFFKKKPVVKSFSELNNRNLKKRIDSLVAHYSLDTLNIPTYKSDTVYTAYGKGRFEKSVTEKLKMLSKYLEFGYYKRLEYNPGLQGEIDIMFMLIPNGSAKNINIINSSLNDTVFENVIIQIIKEYKFGKVSDKKGTTPVTYKFKFPL